VRSAQREAIRCFSPTFGTRFAAGERRPQLNHRFANLLIDRGGPRTGHGNCLPDRSPQNGATENESESVGNPCSGWRSLLKKPSARAIPESANRHLKRSPFKAPGKVFFFLLIFSLAVGDALFFFFVCAARRDTAKIIPRRTGDGSASRNLIYNIFIDHHPNDAGGAAENLCAPWMSLKQL